MSDDSGDSFDSSDEGPCNTSSEEFDFSGFDEDSLPCEESMDENSSDSSSTDREKGEHLRAERRMLKAIEPMDARIGLMLSNTPTIVESILSNMNGIDLNRCSRVCQLWNSTAKIIKRKRIGQIGMMTSTQIQRKRFSADNGGYVSDDFMKIGFNFSDMINKSPFEPHFGLMFCSETIIKKPHLYFLLFSRKRLKEKSIRRFGYGHFGADYIEKLLPPKCSFILCTSNYIIGTPPQTGIPIEMENESYRSMSAFFMAKNLPGVEVNHFPIVQDIGSTSRPQKKLKVEDVEKELNSTSRRNDLKCVLFFMKSMPKQNFYKKYISDHVENGGGSKIAIGGAVADKVLYCNSAIDKEKEDYIGSGVTFSGPNVDAASIILPPNVSSEKQAKEKLSELKTGIKLRKHTVGFLFACCGRGGQHYGADNVESNCFSAIFPKVPLYGFFGNGEIGMNYSNIAKVDTKPNTKKASWHHTYSSVFVILTWD